MKIRVFALLIGLFFIGGCSGGRYTEIDPRQPFIASVNTLQPSLSFFTTEGEELAKWEFNLAYTGAALIQHDQVLLYGNGLSEAHLYELSTGRRVATIRCGAGTTNAYYDGETERFFMTNSKTNTVTSYDLEGGKVHERKLYNYPMSMAASDGYLYVVNYKDTVLSILDIDTFRVVGEWTIDKSSHGIAILEEERTVWLGGHGVGSRPNDTMDVYYLDTGEKQKEISMPLMPVGVARNGQEVAVISHGKSTLYVASTDGEILWQQKVGANPFAVAHLGESVAVAGYDDQMIYFVNERGIEKKVKTKQGPFQLLVREGMK